MKKKRRPKTLDNPKAVFETDNEFRSRELLSFTDPDVSKSPVSGFSTHEERRRVTTLPLFVDKVWRPQGNSTKIGIIHRRKGGTQRVVRVRVILIGNPKALS
ncbi:hypothetical protein E4U43_004678 [Claviceps pusilla]|uniref:Uncharacterized protein n=1 Tax=Claviceps pusilla TaxID=123648 RepID=A0A9P7T092_9HYPO|nr:hypothetical protein E4U43_004678 [Claviceps pusilla]